ncbi:MAG: RNA polymerase sigma factor [Planctomycetes bacterium]|nr:RNA polymerase sigma factor [Planctomycetota bacterium]
MAPGDSGAGDEPPDTERLARAALGGDPARFRELYERIAPALYAWASIRIRPALRGTLDPEDVVQEVWSRAWRAFPSFDPATTSFRAWIFRIGKNVLLEGFRKVQRGARGEAGPTTRAFQLANVADPATAISQRVARDDGIQKLLAWVGELDADERALFVHVGLEGLSYTQAGERMGLAKDTVAKRWQTLRGRLVQFGVPRDFVGY